MFKALNILWLGCLVSAFSAQVASAKTIGLGQMTVDKQSAFSTEVGQKKLHNLIQQYVASDASIREGYKNLLINSGVPANELAAHQKNYDRANPKNLWQMCLSALSFSLLEAQPIDSRYYKSKLVPFTEFVISKGLKVGISIFEATHKSVHHVIYGPGGIINMEPNLNMANVIILPKAFYSSDVSFQYLGHVEHVVSWVDSALLKLNAKKVFVVVDSINGGSSAPKSFSGVVHTDCGYMKFENVPVNLDGVDDILKVISDIKKNSKDKVCR